LEKQIEMVAANGSSDARPIDIIGVASGLGSPDTGCADAPETLRNAGLIEHLTARHPQTRWVETLRPALIGAINPIPAIAELCNRLASVVRTSVQADHIPLVLSGDHSAAIGTWSGAYAALAPGKRLGLLWIDAHLDSHTPQTTYSKNIHGMPLAALLGFGDKALTGCLTPEPKLDPNCVCIIGARSCEAEESELLENLGVRVYMMAEIRRRGLDVVMREALQHVTRGAARFGVTLDIDAIDPQDAPAVSCPEAAGLGATELQRALAPVCADERLACFEIAEFNPRLDRAGQTLRVVMDLCSLVAAKRGNNRLSPMDAENHFGAANYDPLPVILVRGKGARLWDDHGREYLDMMSAYSAVSHGHCHPRLVKALTEQAGTLCVTSRAYFNDRLPRLLERLTELTGLPKALPVNTGLEAVETALKAARKWAHRVKGVPDGHAQIIACEGNFHGRSLAIVSMSTEPQYRAGFGPMMPGFKIIPFGDASALEAAIGPNTAAFLVEPIQGEGGIIIPPAGYLAECARICRTHNVLLIADEIQTGLGRTGAMFACQHERILPDGLIVGKALGGGLLPVSAFLARADVMGVFTPGDHGSTFGGNPLAARVALEAIETLIDERLVERSAELGEWLLDELRAIESPLVCDVRGKGLLIGIEIDPALCSARTVCERLMQKGVLSKDTHHTVIRVAPPLVITREQLRVALARIREAFSDIEARLRQAA
jgi:ornithine--oxo-acid transaminase